MILDGLYILDEQCDCKSTDVSIEGYPSEFFVGESAVRVAKDRLIQLVWPLDTSIQAERAGRFNRAIFVRRYWAIHVNGRHVLGLVR